MEDLYKSVVGNLDCGVIVIGPDRRIKNFNTWMEHASGLSEKEVIGKTLDEAFSEEVGQGVHRAVDMVLKHGVARRLSHLLHKKLLPLSALSQSLEKGHHPPEEMAQKLYVNLLSGKTVEERHCLIQVEDVSFAVNREHAFRRAKEQADQANIAKSLFLSRLSHEMRTPLNIVHGYTQLLDDRNYRESRGIYIGDTNEMGPVKQIKAATQHLVAMIDDLLDIPRIEEDIFEAEFHVVDLKELADEAISSVDALASVNGVTLLNKLEEAGKFAIEIDRDKMRQILLNLLSNSIRFNKPGGQVFLDAKIVPSDLGPSMVEISVADTGIGISPERQKALMGGLANKGDMLSRFSAGSPSVGLTITRWLVEKMAGMIELESSEGLGSTFRVSFPLTDNPIESSGSIRRMSDRAIEGEAKKILYIEDIVLNIRLMESIFKHIPNVKLVSVGTGEEGILSANEIVPDLIVSDINLPGISGIQVAEELKSSKRTKHIPLIALSADASQRNIDLSRGAGYEKFLKKPLGIKQIKELIELYIPLGDE